MANHSDHHFSENPATNNRPSGDGTRRSWRPEDRRSDCGKSIANPFPTTLAPTAISQVRQNGPELVLSSHGLTSAGVPIVADSQHVATQTSVWPWSWLKNRRATEAQSGTLVNSATAAHELVDRPAITHRIEAGGFWLANVVHQGFRFVAGLFGVTFVLAWIATIPIVQLLALGFLVEVTHRVIQTGRLSEGIVGRQKGWFLFKLLIGVGVSLLPLYFLSRMRFDAWLIAPGSVPHIRLQRLEILFFVLTVLHLLGAGLCGGRLRHFLWPVLLPWYLFLGAVKWLLRRRVFQWAIHRTVERWFPQTVAAFFHSKPLRQWFVPMVVVAHVRQGTLLSEASIRFWNFASSLRLWHYGRQGFGALIGVTLWFAGPTFWILSSTRSTNPGIQVILYLVMIVHLFLVLLYFPFVHARFCETLKLRSYFEWRIAGRPFRFSPFRYTVAMTFSLLLSTPLWLMRIAMVPYDLWWVFSLFYVTLLWPTWMLWGWATHHGVAQRADWLESSQNSGSVPNEKRHRPSFLWAQAWRCLFLALVGLQLFLTILSIYVCWQGAFNVLLHPMFHIPTPFGPNA